MKNIFKVFILIILICTASRAYAKDAVISDVTISENSQGYNIVLDTTQNVRYKKVSENSKTIYFEIKGVKAKEDIPVKYENIKTIESVTLQKVSNNKIRIYIKGDVTTNGRLYIKDRAGNPYYIEANKFGDIDGKNIILLIVSILAFSIFVTSDKKDEAQISRAVYDNNVMLQNMRQNKIVRINDFLAKENATNPIRGELARENNSDLEMARKSA